MTQLDLFGPAHVRKLQAENTELKETLAYARTEYRKRREEIAALEAANAECQALLDLQGKEYQLLEAETRRLRQALTAKEQELGTAQHNARYWQAKYDIEHRVRGYEARQAQTTPRAPTLEPSLKKLLTIAHPDRWQRGQPAAELAHELSVAINSLRAEERP
jgi:chromosome segregation ATPase